MEKQIIDVQKKMSIIDILQLNDGVIIFENKEDIDNNFIIPIEIGRNYNQRFHYNKKDIEFILEYCKEEPFPYVLTNGKLDENRVTSLQILNAPFPFTKRERRLYSIIDALKKIIVINKQNG